MSADEKNDSATAAPPGVLIVANPFSGARQNRRRVETLMRLLERHGLEPDVVWNPADRDKRLHDPSLHLNCRCLVAAGGDGTIAQIINLSPAAPLAVLPLGTENVFARALGFSSDATRLARAIASCKCRALDLGRAGDRLFSLMLGVGFDADVIHRLARWRMSGDSLRRVTYWSYVGPVWDAVNKYSYAPLELEADGVRVTGAHAIIFNQPCYALGLALAPKAKDDDGLLNWIVIERPGLRELLSCVWAGMQNCFIGRSGVRCGVASRIKIRSESALPAQADGEAIGHLPLEIDVKPHALRVIAM